MPSERRVDTQTHVDARVIGQDAVVGQRHVLLLPLFVERVSTALQQDTLAGETAMRVSEFVGGWDKKKKKIPLCCFTDTITALRC